MKRVECSQACQTARTARCRCSCGGVYHGIQAGLFDDVMDDGELEIRVPIVAYCIRCNTPMATILAYPGYLICHRCGAVRRTPPLIR